MKIRPVGALLLHADGHDEANNRISQILEWAVTFNHKVMVPFVVLRRSVVNVKSDIQNDCCLYHTSINSHVFRKGI